MKDLRLEQMLISAAPESNAQLHSFVTKTMERIRVHANADANFPKTTKLNGLLGRVKRLHGISLALFIMAVTLAFGGITYAAIKYIPDLIRIDKKETNSRGQTEYTANNFTDCQKVNETEIIALKRFAIIQGTETLPDSEITKILQAKCELLLVDDIIRTTWPTNKKSDGGQNNTELVYSRAKLLTELVSIEDNKVKVINSESGQVEIFSSESGKKLKVLDRTVEVPPSSVHPGDTLMIVGEVVEGSPGGIPKETGLVGLVKLSLPLEYYFEKQRYIVDIPACLGNQDEFCPSTPHINIYPRLGGEGAINPYLPPASVSAEWQPYQISGEVTEITGNRLVLRSYSNNIYSVTLNENGISDYNTNYSTVYTKQGTDATVRVGSPVYIVYFQPPGSNPKDIKGDQVMQLNLMLRNVLDYKKQGLDKQY